MSARRTQDVIEVTMTDHRIVRDPGPGNLTAPIAKQDTDVVEIELKSADHGLSSSDALTYKAVGVLRHTAGRADYAADTLAELLEGEVEPHFEPWYELARSYIQRRDFDLALKAVSEADLRAPGHPVIIEMLAISHYSLGNESKAIEILTSLLAKTPKLPDQRYKLAVMLNATGRPDDALAQARFALESRHNHWLALRLTGEIQLQRDQAGKAANAFRRALAIEPDKPRTRKGLIEALEKLGRTQEAAKVRR